MVNYGVSRGCETCKRRRKKCDETRPTCKTCAKLSITCLGYRNEPGYVFRNATAVLTENLPSRPDVEASLYHSVSKKLIPADDQVERDAISSFFDDYVVISQDPTVSRGFLDGVDRLIMSAGESSNIAQAARIVALGGAANRFGRQDLLDKSRSMYGALLGSFRKMLLYPATGNTMESLMTVVLLGIYEIISDIDTNGKHAAHVAGVAALLNMESSPFKCNTSTHKFQLHDPLHISSPLRDVGCSSVLCVPDSNPSVLSLNGIFEKFATWFHRAEVLFSDAYSASCTEICELRDNATLLDTECCKWAVNQKDQWLPRTIGSVTVEQAGTSCWPGPVDTFFDLYVASIWNTYRKTHLMVLDIICKCSERLGSSDIIRQKQLDAERIAEAIAASIPFHLTADAEQYLQYAQAGSMDVSPPRPVGGLLLLHPLHTAARCTAVSQELRDFMYQQLEWIGKVMGIGQAGLLGNPSIHLPWDYVAEGHLLIWAGMLIRPV